MLKLLRQYNQWILAVGGTLLLVAFLMPTAIQNCAQQSAVGGAVWATYEGGGELTGLDLDDARRELMLVEFLGNPDRRQDPIAFIGADRDPAHWWLLVHEAERAGLVGGQGEGLALIAARAAAQTAQGTPISTEQAIANLQRASESTRHSSEDSGAVAAIPLERAARRADGAEIPLRRRHAKGHLHARRERAEARGGADDRRRDRARAVL